MRTVRYLLPLVLSVALSACAPPLTATEPATALAPPPSATPQPTLGPPTATNAAITPVLPTVEPATLAPTSTLPPILTATPTPVPSASATLRLPVETTAPVATRAPTQVATAARPAGSPAPTANAAPPLISASGVLPVITSAHKQIYRNSVAAGKDLKMFAAVGDCNSQPSVYLRRVATGEFNLAAQSASLRETASAFSQSFSRVSLAAGGGFTAAALNDSVWADGALCGTSQTPFECEVWVSRASVVFIQIGTGDQYAWRDFERNLRPLIQHALSKSVLPVLLTKADDLESRDGGAPPQFINDVVRRLAREYGVPLIDFWLATRALPNNGLLDESDLDFHLSPAGMDLHIRLTLEVLDAIRR
ncbi:MAG: GDSL-type esterase/lipase family protein [Thermoflexales bacterium]